MKVTRKVGSATACWGKDSPTTHQLSKIAPTATRMSKSADGKKHQFNTAAPLPPPRSNSNPRSTNMAARTTQSAQIRSTKCRAIKDLPHKDLVTAPTLKQADFRLKVKICSKDPRKARREKSASSGTTTNSKTSSISSRMMSPQHLASQSKKSWRFRRD